VILATLLLLGIAPQELVEDDYYRLVTLEMPAGLVLEVGGIAILPDGRPMVCTRRGQVWIVDNAYSDDGSDARFTLFADGLHEPLGLLVHDEWIYTIQRAELSRMRDEDGDDRMDVLETVADTWRISGNYHEYSFGPRIGPDGNLWITTNKPFGNEPFGRVDWRGFALAFTFEGEMKPIASGLRSPAGIEAAPWGDMFYTDNQGEWCGASKLAHIEPGDFMGHPWGTFSCKLPEWPHGYPGDSPDGMLMPKVPEVLPSFKLPAVWFPYDKMGRSPAGFVWDTTAGAFGPFAGQMFVGDQYAATVMRVSLEEVNGHWQGACYPFKSRLLSGVLRLAWGKDDSLFVGMTDRGWAAKGSKTFGLQRLVWTGKVPFEVKEMRAVYDGFELEFTLPVRPESVLDPASYRLESYTYELHSPYGSAEMDKLEPRIKEFTISDDGRTARIRIDDLRAGYVHELHLDGIRSADGQPLLHAEAYYTLIEIPKE